LLARRVSLQSLRRNPKARWALGLAAAVFVAHFSANAVTYLVRRPWWDRLEAIRVAGRVPKIQKMFSPEWPAVFYLPRKVPSKAIEADLLTIRDETTGLADISVASDGSSLRMFAAMGFKCVEWSDGTPPAESADPVPRAYHCTR
ncbi:MAG: hypothetical protein HY075_12935, partial [Deltaproteobacteria bacterium]|nr:hypothetical protein [Deltaproteobacteria bacterium]